MSYLFTYFAFLLVDSLYLCQFITCIFLNILITFISHHAMDGYKNDKNQWTIKTLVGEAVHSDSPEATKEKGIQQHTGNSSGLQIQEKIFTSCGTQMGKDIRLSTEN